MAYELVQWGRSTGDTRPTTVTEGWIHYDETNGRYEFYDGSEWLLWSRMARISGSTYSTIQHMQDIFHSSGYTSGGAITDAGGGNIDVAAGTGLIRATDDATDTLLWFDWPASSGVAVASGATKFVGVEYNGGTPQVVLQDNHSDFDFNTDFVLGVVVNEGGTLHIQNLRHAVGDHASLMIQRAYATMPLRRDERAGGLILGETGTRNVTLTAGTLWEKLEPFAISAIDTSGVDTFETYYRDGVGGWTLTGSVTQWPNTQYDDGSGTLNTMTNNRYANLWFYVELDGALVMLYGQAEHVNLANAEAESPPSSVPDRLVHTGKLIGRIVFQKSGSTAESVETVFTTTFSASGTTDHGALGGLGDDDHTQYILHSLGISNNDMLRWDSGTSKFVRLAFGSAAILRTTALGALSALSVSSNKILLRLTGEIIAGTGAQAGSLIDLGDLANVGSDTETIGHIQEADGTDWESVLHHPMFQGRASSQTWDGTTRYVEWDTEDIKDSGFTHSTSVSPEEIQCDFDGEVIVSVDGSAGFSVAGVFSMGLQKYTSSWASVGGDLRYATSSTVGGRESCSISGIRVSVANGNKLRVPFVRYAAGSGSTVAGGMLINVRKIRST